MIDENDELWNDAAGQPSAYYDAMSLGAISDSLHEIEEPSLYEKRQDEAGNLFLKKVDNLPPPPPEFVKIEPVDDPTIPSSSQQPPQYVPWKGTPPPTGSRPTDTIIVPGELLQDWRDFARPLYDAVIEHKIPPKYLEKLVNMYLQKDANAVNEFKEIFENNPDNTDFDAFFEEMDERNRRKKEEKGSQEPDMTYVFARPSSIPPPPCPTPATMRSTTPQTVASSAESNVNSEPRTQNLDDQTDADNDDSDSSSTDHNLTIRDKRHKAVKRAVANTKTIRRSLPAQQEHMEGAGENLPTDPKSTFRYQVVQETIRISDMQPIQLASLNYYSDAEEDEFLPESLAFEIEGHFNYCVAKPTTEPRSIHINTLTTKEKEELRMRPSDRWIQIIGTFTPKDHDPQNKDNVLIPIEMAYTPNPFAESVKTTTGTYEFNEFLWRTTDLSETIPQNFFELTMQQRHDYMTDLKVRGMFHMNYANISDVKRYKQQSQCTTKLGEFYAKVITRCMESFKFGFEPSRETRNSLNTIMQIWNREQMPIFEVKNLALIGMIGTQFTLLCEMMSKRTMSFNRCTMLRQCQIVALTAKTSLCYLLYEDTSNWSRYDKIVTGNNADKCYGFRQIIPLVHNLLCLRFPGERTDKPDFLPPAGGMASNSDLNVLYGMPLTYAAYISIYDSTFKLAYWYAILTRWVLENNGDVTLSSFHSGMKARLPGDVKAFYHLYVLTKNNLLHILRSAVNESLYGKVIQNYDHAQTICKYRCLGEYTQSFTVPEKVNAHIAWEDHSLAITDTRSASVQDILCRQGQIHRDESVKLHLLPDYIQAMIPRNLQFVKLRYRSMLQPYVPKVEFALEAKAREIIDEVLRDKLRQEHSEEDILLTTPVHGPTPAFVPVRADEIRARDHTNLVRICEELNIQNVEGLIGNADIRIEMESAKEESDRLPLENRVTDKRRKTRPLLYPRVFDKNVYDQRPRCRITHSGRKLAIDLKADELMMLANNFEDVQKITHIRHDKQYRVGLGMQNVTYIYYKNPPIRTEGCHMEEEPPMTPAEANLAPIVKDWLHALEINKAYVLCALIPWAHFIKFNDERNIKFVKDPREVHVVLTRDQYVAFIEIRKELNKITGKAYATFISLWEPTERITTENFKVAVQNYLAWLDRIYCLTDALLTILYECLITTMPDTLEQPTNRYWLRLGPELLQKKNKHISFARAMCAWDRSRVVIMQTNDEHMLSRPMLPDTLLDSEGDAYNLGDSSLYINFHPCPILQRQKGNDLLNPVTIAGLGGLTANNGVFSPHTQINATFCSNCGANMTKFAHDASCSFRKSRWADCNIFVSYEMSRQNDDWHVQFMQYTNYVRKAIMDCERLPANERRDAREKICMDILHRTLTSVRPASKARSNWEYHLREIAEKGLRSYIFRELPHRKNYKQLFPDLGDDDFETEAQRAEAREPYRRMNFIRAYYTVPQARHEFTRSHVTVARPPMNPDRRITFLQEPTNKEKVLRHADRVSENRRMEEMQEQHRQQEKRRRERPDMDDPSSMNPESMDDDFSESASKKSRSGEVQSYTAEQESLARIRSETGIPPNRDMKESEKAAEESMHALIAAMQKDYGPRIEKVYKFVIEQAKKGNWSGKVIMQSLMHAFSKDEDMKRLVQTTIMTGLTKEDQAFQQTLIQFLEDSMPLHRRPKDETQATRLLIKALAEELMSSREFFTELTKSPNPYQYHETVFDKLPFASTNKEEAEPVAPPSMRDPYFDPPPPPRGRPADRNFSPGRGQQRQFSQSYNRRSTDRYRPYAHDEYSPHNIAHRWSRSSAQPPQTPRKASFEDRTPFPGSSSTARDSSRKTRDRSSKRKQESDTEDDEDLKLARSIFVREERKKDRERRK